LAKHDVFGLATLEEIYYNRVILMRNGKYETLRLPEEFLSREHYLDNKDIKAEKKRIATDFRNLFLSRDGMELIKLFGFKTLYRGGGFIGFIVTAMGDKGSELMETLGVRDGDLITVVNGMTSLSSVMATRCPSISN
jgi:type II secretory pathway component PulC